MRLRRGSTALALVALAVALGGTGYAATMKSGAAASAEVDAEDQGSQGPPGFSSLTYVADDYGPFPAHSQNTEVAACGANLFVVGGGVVTESQRPGEQEVNSSYPSDRTGGEGTTAWAAAVDNVSSRPLGFTVYAICAPSAGVSGPR